MTDKLGVIFDMDGVLVDSYQAHFKSWQVVAAAEGLTITEAEFASTFGCTTREIIAARWRGTASARTPHRRPVAHYDEQRIAALDEMKEAAFRDILRADFPAMPGAMELLRSLDDAGFALALGSSGPPENVDLVLDKLEARPLFKVVVTGADVTRGKPDPQVFQIASQRLGIPPARCVVVEDAPAGVAAANAAGMISIGFASTGRWRQQLSAADLTIGSLAELAPEILRELICRRA